ncbi:hypothetical protein ACIQZD_19100 [Peribacillus sp. NPDC096447]
MIAASHPFSAMIFTIFFVNSRHLLLHWLRNSGSKV